MNTKRFALVLSIVAVVISAAALALALISHCIMGTGGSFSAPAHLLQTARQHPSCESSKT